MLDTVTRVCGEARASIASAIAMVAVAAATSSATAQARSTPSPTPPAAPESARQGPQDARRGVVVMADGSTLAGVVAVVDGAGVSVKDGEAPARVVPWSECIGVVFDGVEARLDDGTGGGVAVLADGRRIPGRAEANASGMRWRQHWLGLIELPQSSVRWISFDGDTPAISVVDADAVRLRTGDRLEGFVSRLSDPLVVEPRAAGSATQVPLDSVQSVAFVIAEVEREAKHRRVWLHDGTVIDAEVVELGVGHDTDSTGSAGGAVGAERGADDDAARGAGAERGAGGADDATLREIGMAHGRPLTVPRGAVAAVAGERRGGALAHRPMRTIANDQSAALRYEITPAERLTWPRSRTSRTPPPPTSLTSPAPSPPTGAPVAATGSGATATGIASMEFDDGAWSLGLPAFAFDGPAVLRIEIDEPAMLSARLVLPRDRRPRGDFEVVVRSGGREVARRRFDASQPPYDVAFDVVPPAVEFEIVDTGGGAVQDGVVIERGVLIPRATP